MLNNRRRTSDADIRRARRQAAFSMLFSNPLHIVVAGFALVGLISIVSLEFKPLHWLGACYQLELRGGRVPICMKHIPFSNEL
jgi:hypothetical protein